MVLMRSEDINVRRCAVEVLKNLQDPHTADELLRAMKDSDWWVREIASSSLTELKGDNNIIKAFIAMTSDPDENIRRCAVEFFNKIIEPTAYDALVSCLSDQDWWVREKAMRALGAMRDERAIAPLTAMVEDRFVGWAVPETLGAIGGGKAGEEIERLLFHPNKRVRAEAIKTVAAIDFKAAVPQLQTCLQDPEEEVRKLTVAALKQLTGTTYSVPAAAGAVDAHGIVAPKIAAGTSVSEAILVLHLCNSSGTAGRGGSSLALPPMHHLTELVTPMMAKQEECRFMKSTGDGFLMTFPTSENAVRFARSVLREAVSHNATADAVNQINLRFAVNFGEVEVDEKGNRLGLAVSIAFRVESVKPEGLIPVADGMDQANMPSVNSILVTESVARELSKEISMNLVGLFELKGITGLHRIHAVA
jgi:class 3 adenylate cyclase